MSREPSSPADRMPASSRRAAARATNTASRSRTWCCCAPRTACRRRKIPPRKILRVAAPACARPLPERAAADRPAHQRGRQRRRGARRRRCSGRSTAGQLLMDFEVAPAAGTRGLPAVKSPPASCRRSRAPMVPARRRARGERPGAGRSRLPARPRAGADDADPYLNLGALLCDARALRRGRRALPRGAATQPARAAAALQPRDRARGCRPGRARWPATTLPPPRADVRRRALQRGAPARAARRRHPGDAPLQRLPAPAVVIQMAPRLTTWHDGG